MHLLRSRSVLIVLTLLSASVILSTCSSETGSGNEGDFVLNTYTGADQLGAESISFDELVANEERPILLNFWAGNCPSCRAEMPALEAAWREYGDKVLFIGVDIGPYTRLGTYEQGKSLVEEFGITYPTGNTGNRSVIVDWQVASMPSTFLINADGRVHDIVIGGISSSRLTLKVRELIAENAG